MAGPRAPGRIISGGQSGVDRAALDAAMDLGIPHGGWCPRGRRAEDGPIPSRYNLTEAESSGYPERTELNIRQAAATLILNLGELDGGTRLTMGLARKHGAPCLVVELDRPGLLHGAEILDWLERWAGQTLNVAGPSESKRPGVYARAREALVRTLGAYGPALNTA
ncbi:putative molybdenum carrier protein [Desulfohalovibrio reitneri]|uniref:putative molybdenum carrier protein n=1 Tax=Desulfohalovibrio reitneri TaxID=1307759 RepID=UPI0006909A41|nr:putative molybdenum carrier protein [Desulfohalovibrio reitneri]